MRHARPTPATTAVVIGASIAGLLAARVLAESFDEVILLERDLLPLGAAPRKGTPHATHAHGLLARGLQVIEELLPGFSAAVQAQGGSCADLGESAGFYADGRRFASRHAGLPGLAASRLLIESEIRRRVLARPGIRCMQGVDVIEPVHDAAARRVTGVRWRAVGDQAGSQSVAAQLVVDCSGRASRSPGWLRAWGYEAPAEERVQVGLAYLTAYFERDPTEAAEAVICTATPALPRPGVLIAQEGAGDAAARWVVTVGGYQGDHPETSAAGLAARAREIGCPQMVAIAEQGRRIGGVHRYSYPHSQRRRYERLSRFPAGYLVMGDALTSFNPIYGQGMTVAACEALALRATLAAVGAATNGLHRRFFGAAARIVDVPWQLAVGNDLGLPHVTGPRPLAVRLVNAYVARLYRAARSDAEVALAFLKVVHLVAPPQTLFAPGIVWRVLRRGAVAAVGQGAVAARPAPAAP